MKLFEKEKSQIQGCNIELIVSDTDKDKSRYLLAQEISKHGVNVLLSESYWPRDELFFYPDGRYSFVECDSIEHEYLSHMATLGGMILKGNDFILAVDEISQRKRELTEKIMGVKKGIYVNLDQAFEKLNHIKIGKKDFYNSNSPVHIDPIFNLLNNQKLIVCYDSDYSKGLARDLASEVGYDVLTIPLKDAKYAAVGFVELGDHVVVDRRAKGSIDVFDSIGYSVIKSPKAMKKTNIDMGSIRCITAEMPKFYDKLEFFDKNESGAEISPFWNLDGYKVKVPSEGIIRLF